MTGNKKARFVISIPADASKAEENDVLLKIFDRIPSGTYLKMLFSRELVDWARLKIMNDFCPDVMNHWATDQADLEANRREMDELEKRNEKLSSSLNQAVVAIDTLQSKIKRLENTNAKLIDQNVSLQFDWSAQTIKTRNVRNNLRKALNRFRELSRQREQTWQFTLDKILNR